MSNETLYENYSFTRLRRGMAVQRRVLVALMIRELMSKYGRQNIGFLWIVLEPMILCTGVLVIRSMIQGSEEYGVSLIAMLVTGYLPLTLWRHLSNSGVHLLRRSTSLLYHRDISLFDCSLSLILIEFAGCTLAALIVYYTLYTVHLMPPPVDLGVTLCGWFVLALLSISVMMLFAVLTEIFEAAERFIQPVQYLIMPLSGCFFMVNWLPSYAQKLALYVPMVHGYEMIRAGILGPGVLTFYTPWYPLLWALGLLAISLPLVEKARVRIHFG